MGVATRSEVEEHRQQNNNKASALAFPRSASQKRTKAKNTIAQLDQQW